MWARAALGAGIWLGTVVAVLVDGGGHSLHAVIANRAMNGVLAPCVPLAPKDISIFQVGINPERQLASEECLFRRPLQVRHFPVCGECTPASNVSLAVGLSLSDHQQRGWPIRCTPPSPDNLLGWSLASVDERDLERRHSFIRAKFDLSWSQVGSDLRLPNFASVRDRPPSLVEGDKKGGEAQDADEQRTRPHDSRPKSPIGHILLGLQILFGSICFLIGPYLVRNAFRNEAAGSRSDCAFFGYVVGGLVAFGVGSILILLIGATANLVL